MAVLISPSRMDLGKIEADKAREFSYEVTNMSPVEIDLEPWAGCGCTTPTIEPAKIPARGRAILKVSFDPLGKSGVQENKVGVRYKFKGVDMSVSAIFVAKI